VEHRARQDGATRSDAALCDRQGGNEGMVGVVVLHGVGDRFRVPRVGVDREENDD
jgi:hypothetical protein